MSDESIQSERQFVAPTVELHGTFDRHTAAKYAQTGAYNVLVQVL